MKSELRAAIRVAIAAVGETKNFSNQDILDRVKSDEKELLEKFKESLFVVALKRIINDVKKTKFETSQTEFDLSENWSNLPSIISSYSSNSNARNLYNILLKNASVSDFLAHADKKKARREKAKTETDQDRLAEALRAKELDANMPLLEAIRLL